MCPTRHLRLALSALLAGVLLLSAVVPAARAQEETEHEEEFSYVQGAENGPENWGAIKEEWAACSTGRMQSPIDLSDEDVSLVCSLGYLNHTYRAAEASIVNRGHDIMVRFDGDAGSLVINGTAYYLRQLHWHSPTEHAVDDRRYDMELHMVHESAENKAAVIGILYKIGRPDAFLHKLEPFIRRIADGPDREVRVGVVDPWGARGKGCAYYRYMGSLTTPPCTEGVIWTIIKKVRTVSRCQLELLREAVHDGMEDNARPLQEVNNRDIGIFRPRPCKHYGLFPSAAE
ncbi:alpha carbonic anhydrase 7-like isoform X2 [Phragmites australis]|uniref:alpha carbonic anhydrase 7-like isoform X2 n=1 Tax=Phragmites australis TaxID=29695 RepID=UPI002D765643|nr:alpha carbonic anhydrase 7-like isoform X2 [Phragmites australis]